MHLRRRVWFAVLGIAVGAFVGCYSAGVLHKALGGAASKQNPSLIAGAIAGAVVGAVLVRRLSRPLDPDAIDYDDHASSANRPIGR
ncbi:MAG TPA: hypothetical protein VKE40_04040 [Gemmataceae bacterium]|nr:hypothetical protein [Gemmataceae bacterium]